MVNLHTRHFHGGGQGIVHERPGLELPVVIIAELFIDQTAEPLRDRALKLPFNQ